MLCQMTEELARIDTWGFNVFRVAKACRGTTLAIVGTRLFEEHALPVRFSIKPQTLAAFLDAVEAGYKANPYHNAIHGGVCTLRCVGNVTDRHTTHLLVRMRCGLLRCQQRTSHSRCTSSCTRAVWTGGWVTRWC